MNRDTSLRVRVDVTWAAGAADSVGRGAPHEVGLEIWSLLCRHVEARDPSASDFDVVRRPGIGVPVTLGRPLAAITADVRAASDGHERRAAIIALDAAAWNRRGEVGREVRELATSAMDARALVLVVALDPGWAEDLRELRPMVVGHDQVDARASMRRQLLARVGGWLAGATSRATDPAAAAPAALSIALVRAADDVAAEEVAGALVDALAADGLAAHCRLHDLAATGALAEHPALAADSTVLLMVRSEALDQPVGALRDVVEARRRWLASVAVRVPSGPVTADLERRHPYEPAGPVLAWRAGRAGDVLERCLYEWVRLLYFRTSAPAWLEEAKVRFPWVVVHRPPELLDLAVGALPVGRDVVVVYPDPPVSVDEALVLMGAEPRLRLATPTTLFAGGLVDDDPAPPLAGRVIALSMADSPDAPRPPAPTHPDGLSDLHLRDAIAQLTLVLVRSGARLAYGGHLEKRGLTAFLADTIARHNRLGAGKSALPLVFGQPGPPPRELAIETVAPVPKADVGLGPADAAIHLSITRMTMARECDARVAIGGKTQGYSGRFPGLLEECWYALDAGQPIYVLGGFGGGAGLVADALFGRLAPGWAAQETARLSAERGRKAIMADHEERWGRPSGGPGSLQALISDLEAWGAPLRRGGDVPWVNGLTPDQNRRLAVSRDLQELSTLVMKGLTAVVKPRPAAERGPAVRIFGGSIADLERADAYAVPVVEDLPIAGGCAALDRRLGGAIERALAARQAAARAGQSPDAVLRVAVDGARLAGRQVFVVSLGGAADVTRRGREVAREAAARLAEALTPHGVGHLAVVPFGVDIGVPVVASVGALRHELRTSATLETVTFCEPHGERFAELEAVVARLTRLGHAVVLRPPVTRSAPGWIADRPPPIAVCVRRAGDLFDSLALPPDDDGSPVVPAIPPAQPVSLPILDQLVLGDKGYMPADLEGHGHALARAFPVVPQSLAGRIDRQLDLILDDRSAAIPWEAMRFVAPGATDEVIPSRFGGMRRRLLVHAPDAAPRRGLQPGEPLSVLLVVDGDRGTQREQAAILDALGQLGPRVDVTVLTGATVVDLLSHLRARAWDVVHYAGHAQFAPADPDQSGLAMAGGRLNAASLVDGPVWPPLVIVNACQSAVIADPRPGDAPGPAAGDSSASRPHPVHDPSLVRSILLAGARSFIGTTWVVHPVTAKNLAATLYRRLVAGDRLGDALRAARISLGDLLQANYVLYGDADLRF